MLSNALKKSGYKLRYFTIKHHVFLLITEPPNLCNKALMYLPIALNSLKTK